jgi:hypothetical protein
LISPRAGTRFRDRGIADASQSFSRSMGGLISPRNLEKF